ncbi:transcription [Rhodopirellula islandica]|uniref:Transcription n=1 Tax=Rhodopirellula islandica TaxID=595434 RepID=A0A0J1B7X5_RHOIS|nr:transcription [Rhodopirellula islandica]
MRKDCDPSKTPVETVLRALELFREFRGRGKKMGLTGVSGWFTLRSQLSTTFGLVGLFWKRFPVKRARMREASCLVGDGLQGIR